MAGMASGAGGVVKATLLKMKKSDLSKDQLEVYDSVLRWFRDHRKSRRALLTVGGHAGTGKSTLLGVLAKHFQDRNYLVAYVTYTGRASSVLYRKLRGAGVEATTMLRPANSDSPGLSGFYDARLSVRSKVPLCSTIHRLLYRPIVDKKTEELSGWKKRPLLDREYDLVILDEASMVSDNILELIMGHGAPVLAVGDHGQLPPVMAPGKLMQHPMLKLEKIHRQAERSAIIRLSKHIREGGLLKDFDGWGEEVRGYGTGDTRDVMRDSFTRGSILDTAALCWSNAKRVSLNRAAREELGREGGPKDGEPLICLKNEPPIYNGMRGILVGDAKVDEEDEWMLHAKIGFPEDEIGTVPYRICGPQMNRKKTFGKLEELHEAGVEAFTMGEVESLFDFGYAFTAHKSQGSEFKHAIVYKDRPERTADSDYRKWMYTAVTRASERLTILDERRG
jgi:exodeoxyribonuclease V